MNRIELLSPAGTLRNMRYAFAYGADAVYAGLPRYSLRVRNNDFLEENLATGIAEAHRNGKKFYLATNVLPHNSKIKTFIKEITPIIAMQPDALIMADPGLILLVKENWPDMPIHLSVQANTMNYASVRFWKEFGISRIILSRELSLDEIAEIRRQCPDIELETFVHGALCIAYSGRCLLSGYFNHRDSNQGACTNSCRWKYDLNSAHENEAGEISLDKLDVGLSEISAANCGGAARHPLADSVYLLEEENRPGEFLPVMEDEHGTYIMNSKDLRAIEHVQKLLEIGVDSLKIEGRTKSHYYVARTAQTYREAIDDALAGKPFNLKLLGTLENLAQRGYTDGFYQRHHTQDHQNYMRGFSESNKQLFVGEVTGFDAGSGMADVLAKNKISCGDRLELLSPTGNSDFVVEKMENEHGVAITTALGAGWKIRLPLPASVAEYGLLARYL